MSDLLAQLAEQLSGKQYDRTEVGIERAGKKIVLPAEPKPMRYDEAIVVLQRIKQEEETQVAIHAEIDAFPFDGAYAFMKAMKETYGWATPVPEMTMFGPKPPVTINLEIDYGVYTPIIWGQFAIPNIEGVLKTGATWKDGRPIFLIQGQVKKKHQQEVEELAALTRKFVKNESIYKGKGISLKTDNEGNLNLETPPKFIDLSRVNPDELTFSEDTAQQVQTNVFTPVEYTQSCRDNKIPLKRGILFEGPFGTGKTLTAFVTAQKARANGWTFIMIDRVSGLKAALNFARQYQPCVVFAEDIDRSVEGQDRTVEIDDILNTIDGLESKGSEIMTILTSNNVNSINRAMIRPGRLDAIISIQAPDAVAVQKLLRIYGRDLISAEEDLTTAGEQLEGQIPAVIREVVERSKLYAIGRSKGGKISLTATDLVAAAKGMNHHLALLKGTKSEPSLNEKLGMVFTEAVAAGVRSNGVYENVQRTHKMTEELHEKIMN